MRDSLTHDEIIQLSAQARNNETKDRIEQLEMLVLILCYRLGNGNLNYAEQLLDKDTINKFKEKFLGDFSHLSPTTKNKEI